MIYARNSKKYIIIPLQHVKRINIKSHSHTSYIKYNSIFDNKISTKFINE